MKRITIVGTILALALMAAVTVALAGSRSDPWLGVYTQAVDRDLAEAFSLSVNRGAIINEVVEGSPADEAGLREDDVIIAFDGDRVRDDDDLIDLVADTGPGDEVVLTILRDNDEQEITVEIGQRPRSRRWYGGNSRVYVPSTPRAPKAPRSPFLTKPYSYSFGFFDAEQPFMGVSLIDISERTARSLGADDHGVLIDDVVEDSPAEKAGLEPGDLIVAIDNEKVFEASDVQEIIGSMDEGDLARIEIVRNRDRSTVEVEIELDEDGHYYSGPGLLRLPDLPAIDFHAPKMRGLSYSYSLDLDDLYSDELQEAMEELQRDLERLQKDMMELRESLD